MHEGGDVRDRLSGEREDDISPGRGGVEERPLRNVCRLANRGDLGRLDPSFDEEELGGLEDAGAKFLHAAVDAAWGLF